MKTIGTMFLPAINSTALFVNFKKGRRKKQKEFYRYIFLLKKKKCEEM